MPKRKGGGYTKEALLVNRVIELEHENEELYGKVMSVVANATKLSPTGSFAFPASDDGIVVTVFDDTAIDPDWNTTKISLANARDLVQHLETAIRAASRAKFRQALTNVEGPYGNVSGAISQDRKQA